MDALSKAFSGFGVDEQAIITLSGQWNEDQNSEFRKNKTELFYEDKRNFNSCNVHQLDKLKTEFSRFKKATVLWLMHPWERDAQLVYGAVHRGDDIGLIVEIACTRSSDELLGARKAYHSLFHRSIEEDVACNVHHSSKKLLVALASSYRFEGPTVSVDLARIDALILGEVVRIYGISKAIENEHVVRVLSTRSKPQLKLTFDRYKAQYSTSIDEDVEGDPILLATVQSLYCPATYFSEVLHAALSQGADENAKKALTRVVVTRANVDMSDIKADYQVLYGASLADEVGEAVSGDYKNLLLALIQREA